MLSATIFKSIFDFRIFIPTQQSIDNLKVATLVNARVFFAWCVGMYVCIVRIE